jgi:rod shape-determining protein MreD
MATLLAFPLLAILVVFQSAIVSQVNLLHGSADLILLVLLAWALQPKVNNAIVWAVMGGLLLNIVTALPIGIPLIGYLLATGIALSLRNRVWQVPFLAMLVATILGTLITLGFSWSVLTLSGISLPLSISFFQVLLPSTLLNLLFALPAYVVMSDLASWLFPRELEI